MYKYDRELVITILENISWAIRQIEYRFSKIETSDDFLDDEDGLAILDSICMQLINIGEALKKIDKITDKQLLTNYPEVEWKKVMGMRDIITHHYFDVDAETVYTVCDIHLAKLDEAVHRIIEDISIP